jgi:hypothetical protein
VFLTCDTNIQFQQSLNRFPLAFVVLRSRSNKLEDLPPLVPRLPAALDRLDARGLRPGDLREIAPE